MENITVSTIIVTFNRKKCLSVVLDALHKQTIKISRILVVDNHSTDGTDKFLMDRGFTAAITENILHEKFSADGTQYLYFRNNENVGGSGGFAKAIELINEYESDYTWIMDDDVCPEADCLEKMLAQMTDEVRACIPNRTDENFQDHACVHIDLNSLRKYGITSRKTFAQVPFSEETYSVKDMPFEGPLLSSEVLRKVGLPEKGFFIEFDDTDFATRILQFTPILFVTGACLHRQLAKKTAEQPIERKYNWRNYYSIRNNILFNHKHCKTWRAKHLSTVGIWGKHVLKALYFRHPENIKIINMAVVDGIKNKYGKVVEPGSI